MAARKSATAAHPPADQELVSPLKPSAPRKAFRQWSAWRVFCSIAQLAFIALVWYMPGLDLPSFFRTLAHRFSSPYQFYVVFTLVVFEGSWMLGFGVLYVVYHYERYFQSNKCALTEWPWNRGEPFVAEYKSMIKKAIDEYIPSQISIIIAIFVGFWVTDGQTDWELWESKFIDVLPVDRALACGKLLASLLIFDSIFYWTHYLEHQTYLYQYHRIHHQFNHVYPPLTITGTWGHAIDGLLGSVLPAVVPMIILKFDLVTCACWFFLHSTGCVPDDYEPVAGNRIRCHHFYSCFH
jgi:hypothetical protein